MSKPLVDIEGALFGKKKSKVGVEQTGKELSVPQEKLPEPSKVQPSKVEEQPPQEAAASKPQPTTSPKESYMKPEDPRRRTKNFERFLR